uniref:Alcohol oxidase n=1 Tax=Ganoderma boninense TaxID=34458 RepID=A0A5K1JTC2_9APHY|nr:Alcohol oxidase [Ganoderma boninense]
MKALVEFLKYLFLGTGLLSSAFQFSSTFIPTRLLRDDLTIAKDDPRNLDTTLPENRPDIEFMHIPVDCIRAQTSGKGAFTFLVTLIRPKSEGTVRLVSKDARTPPAVDLGYFNILEDYVPLRAGVRLALRVAEDVRKQGYPFTDLVVPEVDNDEGIDSFIRENVMSCFHYTSTCRMGPEVDGSQPSVVDAELKVHGVKGLRVCDASVFPEIVGSHTMAPAVMVAEKCAEMIKAAWIGR